VARKVKSNGDPDSAVSAAVDVAAWAVEAAKEIAINHQDFERAAALRDTRRALDRVLKRGTGERDSPQQPLSDTTLKRVIPVNARAGHITVVSIELYAHETCVRYIDDRGFERLKERQLRLTDDAGTSYAHYGGAATGSESVGLRGDLYFRPGVMSTAKFLRI
jgi:hypothetical protein